ncbi:MAG: hypothetical protein ACD_50C00320G0005, partial [uncultured bacterium]
SAGVGVETGGEVGVGVAEATHLNALGTQVMFVLLQLMQLVVKDRLSEELNLQTGSDASPFTHV